MKTARRNLKIGVSGVRGIVGETLSPALAADFAASFGGFAGRGVILVGRDTRPSGVMIENAVAAGLLASGAHVLLAGIVPTPTLQSLVQHYDAAGAVAITASHNPAEWNALKFIDSSAFFLTENGMNALLDSYNQPQDDFVEESAYRGIGTIENAFRIHADRIRKVVNVEAIRHAHLKVAVDCCNGVGALYSAEFLRSLGCEVFAINDQPDGVFRRPPEPVAANLSELCETVRLQKCDIGFAQDPDGDRLTVVTEKGEALNCHYTVALAVDQVLDGGDPGPVVVNVQTSRLLESITASCGYRLIYAKVGEINVVEKMIENDAWIGGEGNCGGVIYRRVHPGRDSFSAMGLILERLAFSQRPLSALIAEFPGVCNLSTRFDVPPLPARNIIGVFARRYAEFQPLTFDGLRFDLPEGRILMRSSNTEPIMRLNVESSTREAAEALLERFRGEIEAELARENG